MANLGEAGSQAVLLSAQSESPPGGDNSEGWETDRVRGRAKRRGGERERDEEHWRDSVP